MDTYARSRYLLGNVEQAIEWQQRAIAQYQIELKGMADRGIDPPHLVDARALLNVMEETLRYYSGIKSTRDELKKDFP